MQTHRAYQNTTMVDQQRRTITLSDNLPSSVASGNTSTAHVDNGIVSDSPHPALALLFLACLCPRCI